MKPSPTKSQNLQKSSIFFGSMVIIPAESKTGTCRCQKSNNHNNTLSGKKYFLNKNIFFMTKIDFEQSKSKKSQNFWDFEKIGEMYAKMLCFFEKISKFLVFSEISKKKSNNFRFRFFKIDFRHEKCIFVQKIFFPDKVLL